MANDCCFGMMVVGEKENVNEFITMLDYTHPHNICFARIFDIYECSRKTLKDGRTAVRLDGSCAWSVHSCMMEGYGTYYGDHKNDSDNTLTSLQIEGERPFSDPAETLIRCIPEVMCVWMGQVGPN